MADYIGATPQVNPLMGLLAERLKQAQQFAAKPFGYQNQPAEMLMNLLGVPAVQQTAERLAYGEPLTTGRGMTTQVRPEALEAAMTVAPVAGLLGRGAERGAMAVGRAGERYAEKVVPQIMERGGLPAQLLGDLSQGSVSRVVPESSLLGQSKAASDLPVETSGLLQSPRSLTMPEVPTAQQMEKYGRIETVPLSKAVSFQSARNWENFGKNPRGDLIKGYGDKPVALRLETGEYVIYDGNHRTDLALKKGKSEIPMHVIDVKAYDPAHAGRRPAPQTMSDDELLRNLLD